LKTEPFEENSFLEQFMAEVGYLLFPFSFYKFGQNAWVATCILGVRWLVWLESPLPEKVACGKFDEV
jgi:hypothetical protein